LVETKRGSKRGSSTTKPTRGKSARPLIRSSHGRASAPGTAGAPRAVSRATEGEGTRPEHVRRIKTRDGTPAKPARAARPKLSEAATRALPRGRKSKTLPGTPAESLASDAARDLAVAIATAALDKKAVGLEVLDVAGRVDYADFLVLMTGRSDRQVQALAQGIEDALRAKGKRPLSVEGLPHASWVLMDFGDVVVHVFQDDARSSYDLDGLWMDARRIPLPVPDDLR